MDGGPAGTSDDYGRDRSQGLLAVAEGDAGAACLPTAGEGGEDDAGAIELSTAAEEG